MTLYMYMCMLLNYKCLFVWDIPRLRVAVLNMECDYRLYIMVDILSFTSSSVVIYSHTRFSVIGVKGSLTM